MCSAKSSPGKAKVKPWPKRLGASGGLHMTLENMAAESGGLLAKRKDTCLQFSCKPSSVVYLPSLSCLIGSSRNGTLEVLDIHSGSTLRKVKFEHGGKS